MVVLVVSLYIALPWIVETVVKNTLTDSQIELQEMQFDRPSWASLNSGTFQLNLLSLRLKDQTEVDIRDVLISLDTLDKTSTAFAVVNIKSIQVRRYESSTTDNAADEVNLLSLLPSVLFDGLPGALITVNSVLINQPDIEMTKLSVKLSNNALTAQATLNNGLIKGVSNVLEPLLGTDVLLNINANNELLLAVTGVDSKSLLQLDLKLTKRNGWLDGNMRLNSSLGALDLPLADGAKIAVNDNQFASVTEFSLPAKQVLSADKIIQFTGLSKVLNTAIIADEVGQQTTQLSIDSTLRYSLDKGALRLKVQGNKGPLVQAKGNLRQLVLASDDNAELNVPGLLFVNIKQPIVIEYDDAGDGLSISDGEIALEYLENGKRLLNLQLSDMNLVAPETPETGTEFDNSFQLKGRIDLANIRNPLGFEKLSVGSVSAVINSRVAIQSDQLIIKPSSKNDLKIRSLRFNEHTAKAMSLSIPEQEFFVNLKTRNVSKFRFSVNGSDVSSEDFNMKQFGIQSSTYLKNNKIIIRSTTDAIDAEVAGESYYIPPVVLKSKLWLKDASINQASLRLTNICNAPILNARWQPHKRSGHLIDMRWQQDFSNDKTFRKWLNTSQLPFDVTGGAFAGHVVVELDGDDAKFRQLDVSLKDVKGIYETGVFEGVQLQLSSPSRQLARNKVKQTVKFDTFYAELNGTIKELNLGVKASNIVLKGAIYDRLNDWHFKIPLLKANIFSGLVEVRDEDINFNDDIQLDLIVNQLDLSELVETQGMEGLQTTGKLSGRIPIQYSGGQVRVIDGAMRSIEGGEIRYISPLSQSSDINEQLKLTLDVLENFNYTALNSKIVYDDDTLFLKSAVSGNNPNVANGRPINLNLNIEVALKDAIEAMRIQSGIDSHIEEFIRSKMATLTNQYYCQ